MKRIFIYLFCFILFSFLLTPLSYALSAEVGVEYIKLSKLIKDNLKKWFEKYTLSKAIVKEVPGRKLLVYYRIVDKKDSSQKNYLRIKLKYIKDKITKLSIKSDDKNIEKLIIRFMKRELFSNRKKDKKEINTPMVRFSESD